MNHFHTIARVCGIWQILEFKVLICRILCGLVCYDSPQLSTHHVGVPIGKTDDSDGFDAESRN